MIRSTNAALVLMRASFALAGSPGSDALVECAGALGLSFLVLLRSYGSVVEKALCVVASAIVANCVVVSHTLLPTVCLAGLLVLLYNGELAQLLQGHDDDDKEEDDGEEEEDDSEEEEEDGEEEDGDDEEEDADDEDDDEEEDDEDDEDEEEENEDEDEEEDANKHEEDDSDGSDDESNSSIDS